ncbi:flavodoxin family protein [Clostridioides sp. ES-W-0016-02]|uniref:flavodoxin family protein n=1 Tax=Clostridioides sp. ES-W-0016-02 TaxID=2770788 RepID=UPI001D11DA15|nr:flavodoxin family protein [Clostridioides sp. ES-W-0016-02]
MIITVINGSPRKNGATSKVLTQLCKDIKKIKPNVKINFFNLSEVNPSYCIGCLNCYKIGKCINQNDKVEYIHDIITKSDGVIFGSPTYGSSVTGLFKVFTDRAHMMLERLLYHKPCIAVTTYENARGSKAISFMKSMVSDSGGYVCGHLSVKVGFNQNPIVERVESKIQKVSKKFVYCIEEKKNPPVFSQIYDFIAMNIILKPMAFKNIEQYKGIIDRWEAQGII